MIAFLVDLAMGVVVLPLGYFALCRWMKRTVPNPPRHPFFFVFGTLGGYFLCRAISPSFFSLMIAGLCFPAAFIALIIGLIRSLRPRSLTRFHKAAAACSGVLLLLMIWLANTPDLGGLTYAGTWNDDPGSWSRAMGGTRVPPGVKVLHSRYSRSPHFTYEASYFFELTAPEKFLQDWVSFQKLVHFEPSPGDDLLVFDDRPAWFVPGALTDYDVWRAPENFRLFRNKKTSVIYVADRQGM